MNELQRLMFDCFVNFYCIELLSVEHTEMGCSISLPKRRFADLYDMQEEVT